MTYKNFVTYCFGLDSGERVCVEGEQGRDVDDIKGYLEHELPVKVEEFIGIYSCEEAEELGFDIVKWR